MSRPNLKFWQVYNKFMLYLFQTVDHSCLAHVWQYEAGSMRLEALIVDYVRHFREHLQHFEERLGELQEQLQGGSGTGSRCDVLIALLLPLRLRVLSLERNL